MRQEGTSPDVVGRLADDPVVQGVGIKRETLDKVLADTSTFIGNAEQQIGAVRGKADRLLEMFAQEAAYEPQPIL
jgi:adenylosuccinate lyase